MNIFKDIKNSLINSYHRDRRKFIITSSISVACTIAIVISGVLLVKNVLNHGNNNKKPISEQKTAEGLPTLSQIDKGENPILYDFVNSSISYQSDINPENLGFYYAFLQDKDQKDNQVYVSYYDYGESFNYPPLGDKPIKIDLNNEELENFNNYTKKINKDRKFTEGDWNLYLISQYNVTGSFESEEGIYNYCDSVGRYAGIDLIEKVNKHRQNGLMKQTIDGGLGYPTEWLRKEPYIRTMYNAGYDMNDNFWDRYNVGSKKIYKNKNNSEDILEVELYQIDTFKFKFEGSDTYLNEKDLKDFLDYYGWE